MNFQGKKLPKRSNQSTSKKNKGKSTSSFTDTKPGSIVQQKMQELADNSPQASQLKSVQEMADTSRQHTSIQKKENHTGLPDNLKSGVENLSGQNMDDVKVHYNSDKPATLQAHAYAQGTDIHVAPGQEKHLPHEAWHVVQQKQGRVQPTKQLKETKKTGDAPIQAVMSVDAFKQLTTLGESRKTIGEIDRALQAYHEFILEPVDLDDQVTNTQERTRLIQEVLRQTNIYIQNKEGDDPQHKRLAPVKSFREDVLLEIEQISGNIPSNLTIVDRINRDPDADTTRSLVISIAKAPRAKPWIQDYLQITNDQQKLATMTTLLNQGILPLIFDQAFVNGAGSDLIGTFPKGKNMSSSPRRIINLLVSLVTDLGALKKLVSQRFDIDIANIKGLEVGKPTAGDDTVQAETDWTVEGLKKAYDIMIKLPDGHAISNTSFAKLKRFTGSGGWYGDTQTVSIAYDNIHDKRSDDRTLSDKWNNKGTNVFTGKNSFDKTVRHEVGHAVDHLKGFSAAYCPKPKGGEWLSYDSAEAMVRAYLLRNNSALSNHPACLGGVRMEIAKLIDGSATPDVIKTEVIRLMTNASRIGNIAFDRSIVDNDSIFKDLQKVNLQKPWKSSGGNDIGGRTFVYSSDTSLHSYATAARDRQVSNYQFRAPGEWFAEAYAAFYQPDETQRGYGSVLQGRDATTYDYMQRKVDIPM